MSRGSVPTATGPSAQVLIRNAASRRPQCLWCIDIWWHLNSTTVLPHSWGLILDKGVIKCCNISWDALLLMRVVGALPFTAKDLLNYNTFSFLFSFFFFFLNIYLTMTNSDLPLWKITPTTGTINLCWYWSHASRGVRSYFPFGGGM